MKFIFQILIAVVFFASAIGLFGNNLILFNPEIGNFGNFQVNVASFDNQYNPKELTLTTSNLEINGQPVVIDSIKLINLQQKDNVNLLVLFELSNAITTEDFSFYKQLANFLKNTKRKISNIQFVFLTDKYILLNENQLDLIDSLLNLKYYKKSDLNFFYNSYLSNKLYRNIYNSILLITKSQIKINKEIISNYLIKNNITLTQVNLNNYQIYSYSELVNNTGSLIFNKSDFQDINRLLKIVYYSLSNAPYYKIYFTEQFLPGKNKIKLVANLLEDQFVFTAKPSEFPSVELIPQVIFMGIVDSGTKAQRSIKIIPSNKAIIINDIKIPNSKYKILNFTKNIRVFPEQPLELKLEYLSQSTNFDSTEIIFKINNEEKKLIAYSGNKKNFSSNDLSIKIHSTDSFLNTNDSYMLQWFGSHPLDTFLLEYKLKDSKNWTLISEKATNNFFKWTIPNLLDTEIYLRLSHINPNKISDKVKLLEGHKSRITEISFSPTREIVATASEDGFIYLWDIKTGKQIKTLFQSFTKVITGIDWSKDGKLLAIAANDTTIKIWSIESDVIFKDLKVPSKAIKVYYSANGNYLISKLIDNSIVVWETQTFQIIDRYQFPSTITYFEVNPIHNNYLVTSFDGEFIVYDFIEQKPLNAYPKVDFPILTASFSPAGNNLLIAGLDNKIKIYDIFSGSNVLTIFDSQNTILTASWLRNRQFIASGSNSVIKLWSPSNGNLINVYDQHSSLVYLIKSNFDGSLIASVDQNNIIHLWSPFDFPFTKPASISIEFGPISIAQKKLKTNKYSYEFIQKNDTVSFFLPNILTNQSNFDVNIDNISTSSNLIDYYIDESFSNIWLKVNDSIGVTANIFPREIGEYNLSFNSKSGSTISVSNLEIKVIPQVIDKKFITIDFGNIYIGDIKDTSVYLLQNISDLNLSIDSIKIMNHNEIEFVSQEFPFTIRPTGGVFAPTFRFKPSKIGPISGFIRLYISRLIPIDVYYFANGVAPLLSFLDQSSTIETKCNKPTQFSIKFQNSGTYPLEIKSVEFTDGIADELTIIHKPKYIQPMSFDSLTIIWTPTDTNKKSIVLSIKTNLQSDFSYTKNFEIFFNNQNSKFELSNSNLIFDPLDDFDIQQRKLIVKNIGNILSSLKIYDNLKFFVIDSISQQINEFIVYLSFRGGLGLKKYIDTLTLYDECENSYKVALIAELKPDYASIKIQEMIDFGKIICSDKDSKQIPIYNNGQQELIVSNIYVKNFSDYLQIDQTNLIIPPNSYHYISIKFSSTDDIFIQDTLILISNAGNYPNGIVQIPIQVEKVSLNYFFNVDTLDFGIVKPNETLEKYVIFTNNSALELENVFKINSSYFKIFYTEQSLILPHSEQKITIVNNQLSTPGQYIDSLIYKDICGNYKKVILKLQIEPLERFLKVYAPFPNPTLNNFSVMIEANYTYEFSYSLYDYLGRELIFKPRELTSLKNNILNINLNRFSKGIYLMKLWIENEEYQFKIIKLN